MADVKYEFYDNLAGSSQSGLIGPLPPDQDLGQAITAISTHDVQFVRIYVSKHSLATGDLIMRWYLADGGGLPTGAPLGTGTVDVSTFSNSQPSRGWERIDFDSPFTVTSGLQYCLCFIGTSITAQDADWMLRLFGTLYTGGESIKRNTPGVDPWVQIAAGVASFPFEVWDGDPPAPPVPTEVTLEPYHQNKRAVMVLNNVVWYEDI
jgi:hypothetical protein